MSVHLRLDGTWATCHASRRACPRRFHLADTTLTEARLMPGAFVEALLEGLDPAAAIDGKGAKVWVDADGVTPHRDYDLPAYIRPDGGRVWYQHGRIERGGGRPAEVAPMRRAWYKDGQLHRDGDLPALIEGGEMYTWYRNGVLHREGDRPAIINRGLMMTWYLHGAMYRPNGMPVGLTRDGACTFRAPSGAPSTYETEMALPVDAPAATRAAWWAGQLALAGEPVARDADGAPLP